MVKEGDNLEEVEMFGYQDHELLEKVKAKLGIVVNVLIYCTHNFTEQIVFINNTNHLKKVGIDMRAGLVTVHSKIERKILADIRDYRN